jgi:hypothetical protein
LRPHIVKQPAFERLADIAASIPASPVVAFVADDGLKFAVPVEIGREVPQEGDQVIYLKRDRGGRHELGLRFYAKTLGSLGEKAISAILSIHVQEAAILAAEDEIEQLTAPAGKDPSLLAKAPDDEPRRSMADFGWLVREIQARHPISYPYASPMIVQRWLVVAEFRRLKRRAK